MLLADIASGEVDAADIFFLLATILAVVAGVLALALPTLAPRVITAFIAFAIACTAFALLLL